MTVTCHNAAAPESCFLYFLVLPIHVTQLDKTPQNIVALLLLLNIEVIFLPPDC